MTDSGVPLMNDFYFFRVKYFSQRPVISEQHSFLMLEPTVVKEVTLEKILLKKTLLFIVLGILNLKMNYKFSSISSGTTFTRFMYRNKMYACVHT